MPLDTDITPRYIVAMPDQRIQELANLLAADAFRTGRTAEEIVAREASLLSSARQAELVALIKSAPRTY